MDAPAIAEYGAGNPIKNYFRFRRDPIGFLAGVAREAGDFARFDVLTLRFYLINDPSLIKEALVDKSETLIIRGGVSAGLARLIGHGILTNHGDDWRHSRSTLQPLFSQTAMKPYVPIIVARVAESLDRWRSKFAGTPFPINHELVALSYRIDSSTLFNYVPTFEEADDFAEAVRVVQRDGMERYLAGQDFTPWIPVLRNRRVNAAKATLVRLAQRTAHLGSGHPVDEILSLLFAGTEAPANTLCFALKLLEAHPEWRDRLLPMQTELAADIDRHDLLSQVISETARIYPVGWGFERSASEDVTLGGVPIRKGARFVFSPFLLHRNTRWWQDPERFDPTRFAASSGAVEGVPRYGYLPFGAGPRSCIGRRLALAQMRIALGMMLERCRWMTDGEPLGAEGSFKIRLSRPLQVRLEWTGTSHTHSRTPPGTKTSASA